MPQLVSTPAFVAVAAAWFLGSVSVAGADSFNSTGALSNTSNTPASSVVQAVEAGTPGQGFGTGVSTSAKQIGTNPTDIPNGTNDSANRSDGLGSALSNTSNTPASSVVQAVEAGTPGQGFGAAVSAAAKQVGAIKALSHSNLWHPRP